MNNGVLYNAHINEDKNLLTVSTLERAYLLSFDDNSIKMLKKYSFQSYYSRFSDNSKYYFIGEIGIASVYLEESFPTCS